LSDVRVARDVDLENQWHPASCPNLENGAARIGMKAWNEVRAVIPIPAKDATMGAQVLERQVGRGHRLPADLLEVGDVVLCGVA